MTVVDFAQVSSDGEQNGTPYMHPDQGPVYEKVNRFCLDN